MVDSQPAHQLASPRACEASDFPRTAHPSGVRGECHTPSASDASPVRASAPENSAVSVSHSAIWAANKAWVSCSQASDARPVCGPVLRSRVSTTRSTSAVCGSWRTSINTSSLGLLGRSITSVGAHREHHQFLPTYRASRARGHAPGIPLCRDECVYPPLAGHLDPHVRGGPSIYRSVATPSSTSVSPESNSLP